MNRIKHSIPNTLTCMNLAFGCYACILALCGNLRGAMIAIFVAAMCDFCDGLVARLLKAYSNLGKDLDSLGDVVSFGVAPGMMIFHYLDVQQKLAFNGDISGKLFLLAAFLVPIFSALRLAKFNNDERQTISFIGLPVPANAIFWASLLTWLNGCEYGIAGNSYMMLISVTILVIITSMLLVSEIPMFSFKVKSLSWEGNQFRYILLIAAIALIGFLGIIGFTLTIVLYIILSVISYFYPQK